jgi:hypothetical protein
MTKPVDLALMFEVLKKVQGDVAANAPIAAGVFRRSCSPWPYLVAR